MLQLYLVGTAPGTGEAHYAFTSDCFPRGSADGAFIARKKVADERPKEARQPSVDGWQELESSYARQTTSGVARWVAGCPARASIGGVGGHRMLVSTAEPVWWKTWCSAIGNHQDVHLASLQAADDRKSPADS